MSFRPQFDCLWCGRRHVTRSPEDLEGWAQLCPTCLGRAGDNAFLTSRLRGALAARSAAAGSSTRTAASPSRDEDAAIDRAMIAYYEARAPEYDDWYLRRGRYAHGPIDDMAWAADLDAATVWLDSIPIAGRIVELAAGTGWWSTLLASKGELTAYDAAGSPLDRARDRLLAHGLRAHLHVRDAWAEPEPPPADALFAGFWISHVGGDRLVEFLTIARRWLRPGGIFACIDSRFDPSSSAVDHRPDPTSDRMVRRLDDGREYTIRKVYHEPVALKAALLEAGFVEPSVTTTSRFFILASAVSGG